MISALERVKQSTNRLRKPAIKPCPSRPSWLFLSLRLHPGIMMMVYILHAEITGRALSGQHLHLLTQLACPTTGTKQTRKRGKKNNS